MVKFQYISDLHLEHYNTINKITFEKIEGCDNLFLLGDIGYAYSDIYHSFINDCSQKWKNVFVIYGNHEYYCKSYNKKTMNEIDEEVLKFPSNVYFLNNDHVLLNKKDSTVKKLLDREDHMDDYIKIIGSLLWSNIHNSVAFRMNDYRFIYTSKNSLLTPENVRELFKINKEYILNELNSDTFPTILLTHHGVHELCNGYYQGNFMASGYATNIDELVHIKHLIACINGHTHCSVNTKIPGSNIKLLSNCYGYKGENQNIVKYNPYAVLDV
jgi:predicted phosphodiesterase